MSRIEDALAKLQAERQGHRDSGGAASALLQSVGTVREVADSGAPAKHDYRGNFVEIHVDALRAQGLLAPDDQERNLTDEYRTIKRPLLKNASSSRHPLLPKGNLLMVGSALAGEGKSFTCINLCLSIAREQDWSVVLVDGDCHKPHITRLFGAVEQPGLMDLLHDPSAKFDSFVMPTSVERFALLPAGIRTEHATELLGGSRMESLCAEIVAADPRRMVVFDSAPLLLRPEAQVLAGQVGQVLLVVHANKTPRRAVLAARDRLDLSKPTNLLLNQVATQDKTGSYGDYGYSD